MFSTVEKECASMKGFFHTWVFCLLMRIRWDESKRRLVLKNRDIDFEKLRDLLYMPHIEDRRSEEPEQYRVIGFSDGRLTTFIVEYRSDEGGEYIWVVTAWKSTKEEKRSYDQQVY